MNKLIKSIGLFLLLLLPNALAVTIDKNYEYVTWTQGQSNPQPHFVFSNPSNQSVTVTFSTPDSWITLQTNQITIQNNSDYTFTVTLNPNSLPTGMSHGSFSWSASDGTNGTVDIFISVQQANVTCKLIPMVTDYITKIHKTTPPFTKTFSVMVSSDCPGPVNIQRPITIGTVQTAEGEKPISITGQLSLGWKNPGDTASFDVEFNVKGMQPQTVSPKIVVYGIDQNGNRIETQINFEITIIGGEEIPPEINITTLPDWEFPSTVTVGEQFAIRAKNVNPNLQPFIFPNEKLIGKGVDVSGNTYEFKFVANDTGKITVKYTVMYRGAQIGPVMEKIITVTGAGVQQSSSEIKLDFFPLPSEWEEGMQVSVLCRDAGNNNIIPCTLYLNGQELSGNTFTVPEAGKTIFLSATNPNYRTKDFNYTVPKPKLKIVIMPDNPEEGDTISIYCKDERTNENLECSIYVNGAPASGQYQVTRAGNYTITVSREGYQSASTTVYVSEAPTITYAPEEISRNQNVTITFNKEVEYEVIRETNELRETVVAGRGKSISFVPVENGDYKILANGRLLKVYQVSGFTLPNISISTDTVLIIIAIALIVGIFLKRKKKGFRSIKGYGGSSTPLKPFKAEEG